MKRRSLVLAIACLALAGAWLAAQEKKCSFQIANSSSFEIAGIYICPADSEDWSESFLGEDILANGAVAKLAFTSPSASTLFDLLIEDGEGEPHLYKGLPLPKIVKITVLTEKGAMSLKIEQAK